MRKLGKTDRNKTSSIQEITRNCHCSVICKDKPGAPNYQSNFELQRDWAHTGTMPQGLDI